MRIRHVFWDLGGTLVDSYPSIRRAFLGVLEAHRALLTEPELQRLLNASIGSTIDVLAARYGIEPQEFHDAYERLKREWAQTPAPIMPGAMRAMNEVRRLRGMNLVVTNRDEASATMLIRVTGLRVDDVVCASETMPRKPDPSMHLELLRRHGLDPRECLGVGDRDLDTLAATAAGLRAVQLHTPGSPLPEGVQAIGSLIDLQRLLHPEH
ncbi:HAD family hydrolase [Gulosibacter sp. 10]|uniref:HAD family hydrolase n=1 Tax=Gulosibacter sp. 10 TaxID=1255570 RepID=UPI00097ED132|nr:HAD family hydrolase [Gulosibacter sp. 10]SJM52702.1 hydrolase, haloacid dehalogenase-like family [Gulosibacter sp. 10]